MTDIDDLHNQRTQGCYIARYHEVVRQSVPALTESEWMACCDALNGVWLCDPLTGPGTLWAEIADADVLNGLGVKWGIDAQELARRLRAAPYASALAVIDVVERLWADPGAHFPTKLREWGILQP
jgi:hypothetical protein